MIEVDESPPGVLRVGKSHRALAYLRAKLDATGCQRIPVGVSCAARAAISH